MLRDNQQGEKGLYLVFGGELTSLDKIDFRDINQLDVVGFYCSYEEALSVWKGCAQSTVDNAHQRYFVIPVHHFLQHEAVVS